MNAELSTNQLRRALRVAGELTELRELGEFPQRTARMLRELVPCDHSGYNAIDLDSGRATVVADPADTVFEGGPELLAAFGHQNPILVRARNGDNRIMRLSDYISRRELHRTDLYLAVYRQISLEYQIGMRLPAIGRRMGRQGEMVGLSLARVRRDFDDADRLVLEWMRPHFAATLERLHELTLLRPSAQASNATPADGWCWWTTRTSSRGQAAEPSGRWALGSANGCASTVTRSRHAGCRTPIRTSTPSLSRSRPRTIRKRCAGSA